MPAPPTPEVPHLVRIQSGQIAETLELTGEPVTIGNAPDSTMVIRQRSTSRYHMRLTRSGAGWRVLDLDSREGTHLNGLWIGEVDLAHGDVLAPGDPDLVRLVFLEHPDDALLAQVLAGAELRAPEPTGCPACGTPIARLRAGTPLPPCCPGCRSPFVPLAPDAPLDPTLTRTRFRLAIRTTVSGQPCLVREPMPAPPLPEFGEPHPATDPARLSILSPRQAGDAMLRHAAAVVAVAFTAEGRARAVDAAQDVRTWDFATGEELERIRAPYPVLALDPAGDTAVVLAARTPLHVQLETGALISRGEPDTRTARAAAGEHHWAVESGGHVAIRHTTSTTPRTFAAEPQQFHLALSADGQRLLLAGRRSAVVHTVDGLVSGRCDLPGGILHAAALSADGLVAALAILTEVRDPKLPPNPPVYVPRISIELWTPSDGRLSVLADDLTAVPTALAFSADGRLVAWGDADGRVSCVHTGTYRGVRDVPVHTGPVNAVAVHPRALVVSGGADGRVRRLTLTSGPIPSAPGAGFDPDADGHGPSAGTIALAPSRGRLLVAASGDGCLRAWDPAEARAVSTWSQAMRRGDRLAVTGGGTVVVAATRLAVTGFSLPAGRWLWSRPAEGREPPVLGFFDLSSGVLTGQGAQIAELDPDRGTLRRSFLLRLPHPRVLGFVNGGAAVVALESDSAVCVVDLATNRTLRRFASDHLWQVPSRGTMEDASDTTWSLSPDGSHLFFAHAYRCLHTMDLATGAVWTLACTEPFSATAVGPGGRRVAIAFRMLGLTIWDPAAHMLVARWTPAGRLGPLDRSLLSLAFSADGTSLHAGTREGPLLRFDVP